jgi:hypothetical protein
MSTETEHYKDCLSCRIISGMTLTCGGLFIGYHGLRFKGYSQGVMLAIATGKLHSFCVFCGMQYIDVSVCYVTNASSHR